MLSSFQSVEPLARIPLQPDHLHQKKEFQLEEIEREVTAKESDTKVVLSLTSKTDSLICLSISL